MNSAGSWELPEDLRLIRDTVPNLVEQHKSMEAAGTVSSALNNELYSALLAMAQALR